MLSGFNTNFRYRGVLFHVQTEDSGRQNPHVITHLFYGGNILASTKKDYSEFLDGDELEESLRKLMENLHKSMLKQLSRGGHDEVIIQRLGPDVFQDDGEPKADPPTVTEEELPVLEPLELVSEPPDAAGIEVGFPIEGDMATGEGGAMQTVADAVSASVQTSDSDSDLRAGAGAEPTGLARVFGERVVTEKPLDEVVLDYLVDNARKRRRQPK